MYFFKKINSFILKYIAVIIIIFSLIAFYIPNNFSWMTKYIAVFLSLAMFGMGTAMKTTDFKDIIFKPKYILIGCVVQYLVMPATAWVIAFLLKLPADLALGVILVGCCPGGAASNVITHIANGDVPLSVGMTIVSTLLSPILTPFLVYVLAGQWVEVSLAGMFISVIKIVLLPVLLGIFSRKVFKNYLEDILSIMPLISALAIILIISGIIGANAKKIIESGLVVLVVVILHNFFGLIVGLLVSNLFKFEYKKATAVAIEVGMQNSGLAISLAVTNFAINPLATLPGAVFSVWHNISGSLFASIRKNVKTK